MRRRLASITFASLLVAGGCALDFKVLDTTSAGGGAATSSSAATTGGGGGDGGTTISQGGSGGSGGACCDCDGDGFRSKSCDNGPDCADRDARAHPGQDGFFTEPIYGAPKGSRYDYDCDGRETLEYGDPLVGPPITLDCDTSTKWSGAIPGCGETGAIGHCQPIFIFCLPVPLGSRQQGCR
jgi:hypothetical protein